MSAGPHLCRSCTSTHSGYAFIRTDSMSSLGDSICCWSSPPSSSHILPSPSSVMLPECWGRGWQRCPVEGWAFNGHLFSALWSTTSLGVNGCPLQRPRLRATTTYGYKHKHLEGSLTTWSYSKTKLVGSPLGPMNSPVMSFLPGLQYYIQTVSCDVGFKFNQITLV